MKLPPITPGPWETYISGKVVEIWAAEGSRKPVVKWTGFDGCDRPLREQAANARAIAQVPAMLEALVLAKKFVEGTISFGADAQAENVNLRRSLEAVLRAAGATDD